ncbi:MAG: PKD domain-containing protein, partial [Chloroflexi bacterium]|nr:PKD domain-containing protein [Chloroflexota bacterium]
ETEVYNSQFLNNIAPGSGRGGGMHIYDGGYTIIISSTFRDNHAGSSGGGLSIWFGSGFTLANNIVENNTSTYQSGEGGGGISIMVVFAQGTLTHNIVRNNFSASEGGGIVIWDVSQITLTRNLVVSNTTHGIFGGGIQLKRSNAFLTGNTVNNNGGLCSGGIDIDRGVVTLVDNEINQNSGGVTITRGEVTLINNEITHNVANSACRGDGFYLSGASVQMLHNTVHGNGGIAIYVQTGFNDVPSIVNLTNTIITSHTIGISVTEGSTAAFDGTLWGSGAWANGADWGGEGTLITGTVNIWGTPDFVDPAVGDYHLGPNSAAIDAGVDTGVATDFDGDPRPIGAGYDIGADESPEIPLIGLTATNDSPTALGQPTTLTATLAEGSNAAYAWAFGDGATGTGAVASHTYPAAGTYTAVVTASNNVSALTATTIVTIEVPLTGLTATNDSPTALGQPTTLTVTLGGGGNAGYAWAFGDGVTGTG